MSEIKLDDIHVVFSRRYDAIFGQRGLNNRTYTRKGTHEEFAEWVKALHRCIGQTLPMSEAAIFVGVSRPTVMERVQKGKLTMFVFDFAEETENRRIIRKGQAAKIPFIEVLAWKSYREGDLQELADIYHELRARLVDVGMDDFNYYNLPPESMQNPEDVSAARLEELVDGVIMQDIQIERQIAEARKEFLTKEKKEGDND